MRRRAPKLQRRPEESKAPSADIRRLVVRSTDAGWALMVDDLSVPAWTVSTKKKAVTAARDAAEDFGCRLVIERADGSVQKRADYAMEGHP